MFTTNCIKYLLRKQFTNYPRNKKLYRKWIKVIEGELILPRSFESDLPLETNKDSLIKSWNGFESFVKIENSLNKPTWLKNK